MERKQQQWVYIEGSIGVGKSTLIQHLRQHISDAQFCDEPVHLWEQVKQDGKNILELFYEDPARWSFTFQWLAMITRHEEERKCTAPLVFSERSVGADRHVFASHLRDTGMIGDAEWSVYCQWFDRLAQLLGVKEQRIIYLRASPEECLARIRARNRPGEENITLEYLRAIHHKHESWLASQPPGTVLTLDASGGQQLEAFTNAIRQFVHQ